MLKSVGKYVGLFVLSIILLLASVMVSLSLFPTAIPWLVNATTDYQLETKAIDLELWPLALSAESVELANELNSTDPAIAELGQLGVQLDWQALFSGQHKYWSAQLTNGDISMAALNATSSDASPVSRAETDLLEIHDVLSRIHADVQNLVVRLEDGSSLQINSLETALSNQQAERRRDLIQTFALDLTYQSGEAPIPVTGTVQSSHVNNMNQLDIALKPVDLRSLFAKAEGDSQTAGVEAAMDWNWLKTIAPVRVLLGSDQVLLDGGHVNNLVLNATIDGQIEIQKLSGQVRWAISEGEYLEDTLDVSGRLQPIEAITSAADLAIELSAISDTAKLSLAGELNVNGLAGNSLQTNLQIAKLPVRKSSESHNPGLIEQSAQFMPLSVSANVHTDDSLLEIRELELNAGQSNLAATIDINLAQVTHPQIRADLHARQLVYKVQGQHDEQVENVPVVEPETSTAELVSEQGMPPQDASEVVEPAAEIIPTEETLFSPEAMDFAALNTFDLEAAIRIDALHYNDLKIAGLRAPIKVHNGHLNVDELRAGFADGELLMSLAAIESSARATTEVSMIGEAEMAVQAIPEHRLEFSLALENASIEAAALLPEEQFTGGVTNAEVKLTASGLSIEEMVGDMQGSITMDIADAKVSNSSMNLIGSDLLLEMVNTLNPFAKSDPDSTINCVVVNARIADGKMQFKDSIAIETDKMAVVGDGRLHLDEERVDLSFNPRAQSGLGVNAGTLVKFMKIGGRLDDPKPVVSASGLLKTGVAIGAAVSTGGASLIADGLINKVPQGAACDKARNAF
ncbi:MAG: AsmA-like C-terminal region-containing protein [Pseudomonadota bacterium]